MSAPDHNPLRTPSPRSPRQNPTPESSENCKGEPPIDGHAFDSESSTLWMCYTPADVDELTGDEAKRTLKIAIKEVKNLKDNNKQLSAQRSHYRFNFEMLRSEQEENMKRLEVEHRLSSSNSAILAKRLGKSIDEEQTFRHRHLKAKRRLTELTEDTRRQQLSIEHLKRALATRADYSSRIPSASPSDQECQSTGGLGVLSDAAGLAQLREMDLPEPSHHSHPEALLSPVAFPVSVDTRARCADIAIKKRRQSEETGEEESIDDGSGIATTYKHSVGGRRLTFNSSNTRSADRITPITPRSPRRHRLEPSAMS